MPDKEPPDIPIPERLAALMQARLIEALVGLGFDKTPVEPNAEEQTAGAVYYRFFGTLVYAGFSEDQALTLIAKMLIEGSRSGGSPGR